MKSVNFPHSASLVTTTPTPRPEGDLLLVGVGSYANYAFGYVLVDSGADYVVLPEKAGLAAGVTLPAKPTTTLRGVGGSVGAALVTGVRLEFQSLRIRADVMFDYSNSVRPLFGRSGILALKDIGLDQTDWHWNP
ncbi:MAG: aspartyl protease family protein [Pseudomonadota bacterium]|nr:aspartyl protease family protein [Pseudomonadota bacterium]